MKESKQEKLRMLLQMEVEAAIDNALFLIFYLLK